MAKADHTIIEADGREVRLSNPGKTYFPKPGWTKLDLVKYYLAAADAALVHAPRPPDGDEALRGRDRGGADLAEARAEVTPDWLQTATVSFPSGRTADELRPKTPRTWRGRSTSA